MKLAVKKHIPLPHVAHYKGKDYTFAPTCDVPDELGIPMLKNSSHIFFDPGKTEVTDEGYEYTDQFKNKSIGDVANHLSDENKLKVLTFAKALAKGEKLMVVPEDLTGTKDGGIDPATLQQLSIPKLEAFAVLNDIEIPSKVTKKDDIIAFLVSNINPAPPAGPPVE
jgi:hypothetical protein